MLSTANPWFIAFYEPQSRHWKVFARLENDKDLLEAFGPEYFPLSSRMAFPADDFADMQVYASYDKLQKQKKVAYALPGKLFPSWATGGVALRKANEFAKARKARKEQGDNLWQS